MQTSFEFFLHAPAHIECGDLEAFLRDVEGVAIALGFDPCFTSEMAPADAEKALFRDLTAGKPFRNDVFSGGVPSAGSEGAFLVVTDYHGNQVPLGFARCHRDGEESHWLFRGCIHSQDPRYRALIKMFCDNGLGGIVGCPEAKATSELAPG